MIFSLRFFLSSIAAFAIAAAAGYAFAVLQPLLKHAKGEASPTSTDIPPATATAPAVATPGPELQAPPLAIAAKNASPAAPLPAREAPVAEHYAALAARANDGDVAAARRLADDLQLCGGLAAEFESIQELVGETADEEAKPEARHRQRLDRAEQRLQRYRLDAARCKDSAAWTGEARAVFVLGAAYLPGLDGSDDTLPYGFSANLVDDDPAQACRWLTLYLQMAGGDAALRAQAQSWLAGLAGMLDAQQRAAAEQWAREQRARRHGA